MLHSSLPKRSHKIIFSFIILVSLSMIWSGCKKDEENNPPDPGNIEEINNAVLLQEDAYDQLADLLQSMDTSSAKATILSTILADPMVQLADTNSQGLYIQYKNGMRGGLIIDFEDEPNDTILPFDADTMQNLKSAPVPNIIPADKQTIFLDPHYFERERYTDKTLRSFNERLPIAGFHKPETYLNEECTVEKFTLLENNGIIYIYTHGMAWPASWNISKVYLMTGETVNEQTTNLYWRDILQGDIPLIIVSKRSHKYFVSPDFIAAHNNFSEDTTLVYGAFCYSFLGGWPEAMLGAGAGGYVGVDWAVKASYCNFWARNLISALTRKDDIVRFSIKGYLDNLPGYYYKYRNWSAPDSYVDLKYQGHPDLALLPNVALVDLIKTNEVQCDVMSTIQWTCSTPNLTVQRITSDVNITIRKYFKDWDYETTFTGSIPVNVIGELRLEFNDTFDTIKYFHVQNTWNFNAKDEDLNKYGYPSVKTQAYSGHDLPIWVNEPDFDRYIYGVQGSKAADHLSTLECKYEFPNGSSCSINKFEFTDETLQMIRFDFHIR